MEAAGATLFYQCAPRTKELIVQSLQGLGHVVLFEGDGQNDVPGLEAADLAVAMADGAADAKLCADMLLLGDLGAVSHTMRLSREPGPK